MKLTTYYPKGCTHRNCKYYQDHMICTHQKHHKKCSGWHTDCIHWDLKL